MPTAFADPSCRAPPGPLRYDGPQNDNKGVHAGCPWRGSRSRVSSCQRRWPIPGSASLPPQAGDRAVRRTSRATRLIGRSSFAIVAATSFRRTPCSPPRRSPWVAPTPAARVAFAEHTGRGLRDQHLPCRRVAAARGTREPHRPPGAAALHLRAGAGHRLAEGSGRSSPALTTHAGDFFP